MKTLEPITLSEDTLITKMQTFRETETYMVFVNLWRKEREALIEKAKRSLLPADIAMLDGYDKASSLVERWANRTRREDLNKAMGNPLGDEQQ